MKDEELLIAIINVLKKGYRHDVFGDVPKVYQNNAFVSQDI
jgi:hypothetical protein